MCSPAVVDEAIKSKIAAYHARFQEVSRSPFGEQDEIGMLNLLTPEIARAAMAAADVTRPYDLAVDYFTGMPGWRGAGDQTFQMWMTHTPRGTVVDNVMHVDDEQNSLVGYSGDAISMYTHSGTHVDALNHFGYHGQIFNGYDEGRHLGSRGWTRAGADKHPPIVSRGILLDIPAALGLDRLPASYGIGEAELREALRRQGLEVRVGDVVLIRTGQMQSWPDHDAYSLNGPGVDLGGARFLARQGAAMLGTDTLSFEQIPSADPTNWNAVHCYLLGEAGVPILEVANLEELARDGVDRFAFVGACLKIAGATGSPIRPLAFPIV